MGRSIHGWPITDCLVGLTNFGSLVVSGLGFNSFHTLLIGLPSSVVSAGSMIVWAYFSTRYEGLRTWGMIGPMIPAIAGIATVYGTMNTGANKYGRVVAYWLINSYAVTWPFTLTIIGQNVAGHTKRAATNVLLFMAFSAGNIAGPFFFRSQDAPKYVLAITIILVCCKCRTHRLVKVMLQRADSGTSLSVHLHRRRPEGVHGGRQQETGSKIRCCRAPKRSY